MSSWMCMRRACAVPICPSKPASGVIPISKDIPLELAALLGCGVTTGVFAAINTAGVTPGSTVLVIGSGGVGISVVQGARMAGATEIAVSEPIEHRQKLATAQG